MRTIALLMPLVAACSSSYMRPATPSGPPGPDECKVVFARPSGVGSAVTFPVWDRVKLLGFAENNSYFEYRCKPGSHFFIASAQSYKGIDANLAAGKTYHVLVTGRMGFLSAAVGFTPAPTGSKQLERVKKVLEDPEKCRELDPERGPAYEEKRRGIITEVLEEFTSGARGEIPTLKPADGE